ncbi:MAG: hypothetical protein ACPG5B_15025 [Chitinophagales bacterium]
MKYIYTFLVLSLLFCSCDNLKQKANKKGAIGGLDSLKHVKNDVDTSPEKTDTAKISLSYTAEYLSHFLDSIGNLPLQVGLEKVLEYPDSMFRSRLQLSEEINKSDFEKLKSYSKNGLMDFAFAEKLFQHSKFDKEDYGIDGLPFTFYSFSKIDSFKQFAINPLYTPDVYFFSENKIIGYHLIHNRYGLELEHYKNEANETIIYYEQNYQSGTGIWWYNFYFYKYKNDTLIPILNELQNANLQAHWHIRKLRLKTSVITHQPLTLKMVYYQSMLNTFFTEYKIVEDSTIVSYFWDEKSQMLKGDYQNSKISKPQILSYYLDENEYLFIQTHYELLKTALNSKDAKKRLAVLKYLEQVKLNFSGE